ncbi:MAG TPA: acetylxylan esterase [Gemmataceae bacterium]|nr:acetylxylan esterase [Gemmataceae bacterium]
MKRFVAPLAVTAFLLFTAALRADEKADVQAALDREVIGPRQTLLETQDYIDARVPRMPKVQTAEEWQKIADRLRADVLTKVVFRGEAAGWRDAKARVEWQQTIPGGPGYRIKKLRYEALPGLWIPALLYEPEKLRGRVPVMLAVNGHDGNGKAAGYKQIRCINLAKRGMLVLNVEWLGMGQLRTDDFRHGAMNQLDLCGTSGLAPFFLSMKRGIDVLLALSNADPKRVAVSGLSGGGWQTIFISGLDTRVTLSNPVAGYSSFRTRVRHFKDLGDSEQTPCDLATIADYTHLTAMLAPRAGLLTFNAKDNCCFEAGYAMPPLVEAALPIYRLYGKGRFLRTHVNYTPGDHNYGADNRQALYGMIGAHFFPQDAGFSDREIPSDKEVKGKDALAVELPKDNAGFNTLARALAKKLPREPALPTDRAAAEKWQKDRREKLRRIVKAKDFAVKAEKAHAETKGNLRVTHWKLKLDDAWTVPVVEMVRGEAKATAVLLNDAGRRADPVTASALLAAGHRVLAVDPWYFGESKMEKDWLFALTLATVGDRPLGLQASQVAAVARWSAEQHKGGPVKVVAVGPRTGTIALVAAALEPKAIGSLELQGTLGSLKEIIDKNRTVDQMPELFCFGLLEWFDVKQLAALVAPRPVCFLEAGERHKAELAGLKGWYAALGSEFDPLR